jgi:hypothetical protein
MGVRHSQRPTPRSSHQRRVRAATRDRVQEPRCTYGELFDFITYDAGGFSRANADAVVAAGKDYMFALKDEHRTMCRLADEMLAAETVIARTEDVLDDETIVVRSLRLLRADPSWSYGDGKTPEDARRGAVGPRC